MENSGAKKNQFSFLFYITIRKIIKKKRIERFISLFCDKLIERHLFFEETVYI
jgi:hypothetical protein